MNESDFYAGSGQDHLQGIVTFHIPKLSYFLLPKRQITPCNYGAYVSFDVVASPLLL